MGHLAHTGGSDLGLDHLRKPGPGIGHRGQPRRSKGFEEGDRHRPGPRTGASRAHGEKRPSIGTSMGAGPKTASYRPAMKKQRRWRRRPTRPRGLDRRIQGTRREATRDWIIEGNTLGACLKPNVVPAKLLQCSRLSGWNKKSSKFIYPPTKPTRTWWQNMLFASLGGPRWYAHICCPVRCHEKKTCFQKQFLLEHHWNTARTSYWNVAGTSTLQQEQSTRKGKMVTYVVV